MDKNGKKQCTWSVCIYKCLTTYIARIYIKSMYNKKEKFSLKITLKVLSSSTPHSGGLVD